MLPGVFNVLFLLASVSPIWACDNSGGPGSETPQLDQSQSSSIVSTCQTYSQKVTVIKASCTSGNYEAVTQTVDSLSQVTETLQRQVQSNNFDTHYAISYKEYIATLVVDYSAIVDTVTQNSRTRHDCRKNLIASHQHIQTVVDRYASLSVNLEQSVRQHGGYMEDSLQQANLQFHFHGEATRTEDTYINQNNGDNREDEGKVNRDDEGKVNRDDDGNMHQNIDANNQPNREDQ